MWKRYGLSSLLYYLTESDEHRMFTSEFAEVKPIRLSSSSPRIIQALFAKWYFPCYENTTEKLFICDIDCFILSNRLIDIVRAEENLFHLKNIGNNSIAGYYVAGYPSQLKDFFRVGEYSNFESFCIAMTENKLHELKLSPPNANEVSDFSKALGPDWKFFGAEESYAGKCDALYTKPVSKYMDAPNQYVNRICRSLNSVFDEKKLRAGGYIDYHCPRPYETYEKTIRNILDKTLA